MRLPHSRYWTRKFFQESSEEKHAELSYTVYLEKYHSIYNEINTLRTKTAIILGFLGVIFTLLFTSYYENSSKIIDSESLTASGDNFMLTFLYILILIYVLVGLAYFLIFCHLHLISPIFDPTPQNKQINDDKLDHNGDIDVFDFQNLSEYLKNMIPDILNTRKFYSVVTGCLDVVFLLCFAMTIVGASKIIGFKPSGFNDGDIVCFAIVSALILSMCIFFTFLLLFGFSSSAKSYYLSGRKGIIRDGIITCLLFWCTCAYICIWPFILSKIAEVTPQAFIDAYPSIVPIVVITIVVVIPVLFVILSLVSYYCYFIKPWMKRSPSPMI
ncbi:hypothetical protein [Methanorbis rubei]|uniref:Uncharacterized protein n=1 Tax=Methanorbis rubei TaxID=3028300 RepID=A0AAE4SB88_9EURY|nr:hypothetical protein [Methanocorpusculaceae archaeon Cs1]